MHHLAVGVRGAVSLAVMAIVVGCGVSQTSLAIKVVDARTGSAIQGATVTVNGQDQLSNGLGVVSYLLRPSTYDVSINQPAYLPLTTSVIVFGGTPAARTISMYPRPDGPAGPSPAPDPDVSPAPSPSGVPLPPIPRPSSSPGVAVFGRVTDDRGTRISGALVMVESTWGVPIGSTDTTAQGEYRLDHIPNGQQLRVTAVANGYNGVTRSFTARSDWRIDFSGQFALKTSSAPMPEPDAPARLVVEGTLQDTFGQPLDDVVVHIESYNVRYPFDTLAFGRQGHYHAVVPTGLPLRFTASKTGYRPTTFTDTVPASTFGEAAQENFIGSRALDLLPVPEMGMKAFSLRPKVAN